MRLHCWQKSCPALPKTTSKKLYKRQSVADSGRKDQGQGKIAGRRRSANRRKGTPKGKVHFKLVRVHHDTGCYDKISKQGWWPAWRPTARTDKGHHADGHPDGDALNPPVLLSPLLKCEPQYRGHLTVRHTAGQSTTDMRARQAVAARG